MTDQTDSDREQPTLTITDKIMRSTATRHTAAAADDGWTVTWLPGRRLSRNEAITAMAIAQVVGGRGVGLSDDPIWPHVENWAAELGLSGANAVVRVSEPPEAGQ